MNHKKIKIMKKLSIILLVVMATLGGISCNQKKQPKYHHLSALTHLVLLEDQESGKYKLYDPTDNEIITYNVDTAYVGAHQILCICGNTKEVYSLTGFFLFFAPKGLYIFESVAGTFYAVERDRGYKWYTTKTGEGFYFSDEEIQSMVANSKIMKNFPICRWIDEKYYPKIK